jgi:Flp pilus assembly protein TadG
VRACHPPAARRRVRLTLPVERLHTGAPSVAAGDLPFAQVLSRFADSLLRTSGSGAQLLYRSPGENRSASLPSHGGTVDTNQHASISRTSASDSATSRSNSSGGTKWHRVTKVDDSGQTLLEFALGLMIFLVLVFGSMDFANLLYHKVTLQNAARQAGRYAITGQCLLNSSGACSMSRYLSIQQVLENASIGIINSSNIASDVTIICINEGGGCPTSAGGPGDLVTITVTYKYSFMTAPIARLFPGGTYTIVVSSAFINEPFLPNES